MRKGYLIRSDLSSHHVTPERENRQLDRAQFGIYRSISPEYAKPLVSTLKLIEKRANQYLDQKSGQPATFKAQGDLGATYLEQYSVRRALKHRHLDIHGVLKIVHSANEQNYKNEENEVEVDLLGFGWVGSRDRKLAGQLERADAEYVDSSGACPDNAVEQLVCESKEFSSVLKEIGATALADDVRIPEHVTMFRYSSKMPEYVQVEHKKVISNIVYDQFDKSDISSIMLGPIVVGSGYSTPLELAA